MLVWKILFRKGIQSKARQQSKNSGQKFFMSDLVTKLVNLFYFVQILWKISSHWWFQKKLLTDLTLAQTSVLQRKKLSVKLKKKKQFYRTFSALGESCHIMSVEKTSANEPQKSKLWYFRKMQFLNNWKS